VCIFRPQDRVPGVDYLKPTEPSPAGGMNPFIMSNHLPGLDSLEDNTDHLYSYIDFDNVAETESISKM